MESHLEIEILIGLSNGSHTAFERLYKRFHTGVYLLAKKYTKSEEEAKDIRSNCFIKLWEQRGVLSFDSMAAVYSWLKTTVINNYIDNERKLKTREAKKNDIIYNQAINSSVDYFEVSDKEAAILDRILNRLDTMPVKLKEVFRMRYYDELKFKEISEILHADISTVKKRYARALKILRMTYSFNIF